jgi:hypothetical protein
LAESSEFHATLGIFYMPQIYDMGQTALLPLRRKSCWGFFRSGLNPRTWVLKASMQPLDHRSRWSWRWSCWTFRVNSANNTTGKVRTNVIFRHVVRHVGATAVWVEKQKVLHIVSVSIALIIQYPMRMRHIVIHGLPLSTTFFHIISKTERFRKKSTEHKMCFDLLYNVCPKHFLF